MPPRNRKRLRADDDSADGADGDDGDKIDYDVSDWAGAADDFDADGGEEVDEEEAPDADDGDAEDDGSDGDGDDDSDGDSDDESNDDKENEDSEGDEEDSKPRSKKPKITQPQNRVLPSQSLARHIVEAMEALTPTAIAALDKHLLEQLPLVKKALPGEPAVAATRTFLANALALIAGVPGAERASFISKCERMSCFSTRTCSEPLWQKTAGPFGILIGHADVAGDIRINNADAAGGSTAVTVGALRAGIATAGASLVVVDLGLEAVEHEETYHGIGCHARQRVGAAEARTTVALAGLLIVAARQRGCDLRFVWHMTC